MVGDHYADKWRNHDFNGFQQPAVTAFQVEQLRSEVAEMKALLKRALEYDRRNNEPHCETAEKMEFLRRVATSVGIDLDDVLLKGSDSEPNAKE